MALPWTKMMTILRCYLLSNLPEKENEGRERRVKCDALTRFIPPWPFASVILSAAFWREGSRRCFDRACRYWAFSRGSLWLALLFLNLRVDFSSATIKKLNSGIKSLPSVQLLGMIVLGACPAVFENTTSPPWLQGGPGTVLFTPQRLLSNPPPPPTVSLMAGKFPAAHRFLSSLR